MCFSAPASFTAAGVLLPAGIYSVYRALKNDMRYLFFASVPIFFAIQQFSEGMVWYSFQIWAYVYLAFAYAFWPFYISLSMFVIERIARRRTMLNYFVWAGGLLGAMIYIPIVLGYVPLTVSVLNNSIVYDTYASNTLIFIYCVAYAFILILPMFISSARGMSIFGVLIFAALICSVIWYFYAFTSVWCFFSAALSVYVASILHDVKGNANNF